MEGFMKKIWALILVIAILACHDYDSNPVELITPRAPLDSLKITLIENQVTTLQGSHLDHALIVRSTITLENTHSSLSISDINFISMTLASSSGACFGPFPVQVAWPEDRYLAPHQKLSFIVYRVAATQDNDLISCGDSLTVFLALSANKQELKSVSFPGLMYNCALKSSTLDSLDFSIQKAIIYADYMPVVSPDPIIAAIEIQISNPTVSTFDALNFSHANIYINGSMLLGSIVFIDPFTARLSPGATISDTLYKGVSAEKIFTIPTCGSWVDISIFVHDDKNHFRILKLDSLLFGCTSKTHEENGESE